ncbi:MAG: hypothetical protein RO469_18180 [Thermincola sp.]|nr:hypothetical protein [Thermincola sp.]MDT3701629.1 hypothetical protein [Thermincola sp.]
MTNHEQLALVAECRGSGMTAKEWCKARGVNYRHYIYWASKVNKSQRDAQQQWASVELPKEGSATSEVRLTCGRWTICVGAGFSPALLADVLKVVDAVC